MTAFNVVRFRVKEGQQQAFIDAHRKARKAFKGFVDGWLVQTGDRAFVLVGQWKSFKSIAAARPEMIGMLDEVRGMLEDLGGGLGVTDPVSGEAVVRMKMAPAAKRPATKTVAAKSAKAGAKATNVAAKKSAKTSKSPAKVKAAAKSSKAKVAKKKA